MLRTGRNRRGDRFRERALTSHARGARAPASPEVGDAGKAVAVAAVEVALTGSKIMGSSRLASSIRAA
jgi:hypothetical protein